MKNLENSKEAAASSSEHRVGSGGQGNRRSYGIREVYRGKSAWFVRGLLFIWGGVFLATALYTYIMPRGYEGNVRMEIMPQSRNFEVFPQNSPISTYDPATFMATEQLVVTSKETLYKAIDELQLVKRWDDAKTRADAYRLLQDKVHVTGYPGTRLIDIIVLHTDPVEAADLANAIARAYWERRNNIENSRASAALDMLNAQEALQAQKMEDARIKMIELMEKFNIVDLSAVDAGNSSEAGEVPDTGTRALIVEAKKATQTATFEVSKLQTLVEGLLNRPNEALLVENGDLFPVRVLRELDDYEKLRARQAVLGAQGIGESAPEMLAVRAERDFYEERFQAAAIELKASLRSRLEVAMGQLRNLEKFQNNYQDEFMDERKRYAQYGEAKRDYEQQRAILESMTTELLKQKVDLTMPMDPITIHEIAEANELPATPNVDTMLWSGAGFGLALAIPGALCLMYLAYAFSCGSKSNKSNRDDEFEYVYERVDKEPVEAIEVNPGDEQSGASKVEPSPW